MSIKLNRLVIKISELENKIKKLEDLIGKSKTEDIKINESINIDVYDDYYVDNYDEPFVFNIYYKEIQKYIKNKNIVIFGNAQSVMNNKKDVDDKYDIFIRLNTAIPNEDSYKYIGSRTDIWFFFTAEHLKFKDYIDKFNSKYIIGRCDYGETPKNFKYIEYPIELRESLIENTYRNKNYNEGLNEYNVSIMYPTAGISCIDLFLKLGGYKSLTLYGFDAYRTNNWVTDKNIGEKAPHDARIERKWLDTLYKNKNFFRLEMPEYNI